MRAVQPVADEFLSRDAFALRDLRFVMREDVIDTAAVDIDLVTEQCRGHRTALDVPAGPARPPWRIPFHIGVFFIPRFPQREIADVLLVVFVVLYAPGRLQLREIEVRELSLVRKYVDAKINRFVVGLISEPARNERADH